MSGKTKNKGLHYDTHTNTVMTTVDEKDEQVRHKVSRVLEVCPTFNKEEISIVLQHFAYDEESTVNAFMENGAADILKDWRKTGTKPTTKPKKKKNKKKKSQVTAVNEETENASDNSHNVCDEQVIPSQEDTHKHREKETKISNHLELVLPAVVPLLPKEVETESAVESVAESSTQKSSTPSSPQSEAAKHRSSGSSRTASFSEDTSRHSTPLSSVSSYPAGQGKKTLEKSLKDLSRQTVALQRVHNLLEDELDSSFKRIKSAVAEAHKLLDERCVQLEEEMEKVKKDARGLLTQRQELAAELKRRSERTATMIEAELNDLRADIKNFVVERKYDEELGKTKRFVWDKDRITDEIKVFGEIAQVKNCYSQRRQSASSVASSSLNVTTPTHSEMLNTPVFENLLDSVETSAPEQATEQKDYRQQSGNRSRTYFATKYYNSRNEHRPFNSRGRGYRGGRSGPQPTGSRDYGSWNQHSQFHKHTPHHQRVYNSETTEREGICQSAEYRLSYRSNRGGSSWRSGHASQHNRTRHPPKDLQLNGETSKPADSSSIANGFVSH